MFLLIAAAFAEEPVAAPSSPADPTAQELAPPPTEPLAQGPAVQVGPFEVRVEDGPATTIAYGGQVLATIWTWSKPEEFLQPRTEKGFEDVWLVTGSEGDGCPSMFQLVCLREGRAVVTQPFGNCGEIDKVKAGKALTFSFAADDLPGDADRRAMQVVVRPDCSVVGG